jgi:hypothetical protein
MKTSLLFIVCLTFFESPAIAQTRPSLEQLENRAALLLPTKAQLRFQEIPWVLDLAEAQKIAQAERRPIFLWGYGGRARPDIALEGC